MRINNYSDYMFNLAYSFRKSVSHQYKIPLHIKKKYFIKNYLKIIFRKIKIQLGFYDYLTYLASKYESDKGITIYPNHGYTIHYEKIFESIRLKPLNILEIGLASKKQREYLQNECPSLKIWLDYFPNANVYGFDIDDFSHVNMPRTKIIRGDQSKIEDLDKLTEICPEFDIIIDDGYHASYHQQISLKTLFPHISKNGLYIIEDLSDKIRKKDKSLPETINTFELLKSETEFNKIIKNVKEIKFYNSILNNNKEELAVIFKK